MLVDYASKGLQRAFLFVAMEYPIIISSTSLSFERSWAGGIYCMKKPLKVIE